MNTKRTIRDWIDIVEQCQSTLVHESEFDHKPIPKTANLTWSDDVEVIINYIIKNCQPWLNSIDPDQVVYRATSAPSSYEVVFTRAVRADRRPYDSPLALHGFYNKLVDMMDGTANRSNSAFVTGSYDFAQGFDKPIYVAVPIGNFHYTWSPYVEDLYHTFEAGDRNSVKVFDLLFSKEKFKQETGTDEEFSREKFMQWSYNKITKYGDVSVINKHNLEELIKVDTGLPQAIRSGNEIMISASNMLYIDVRFYQDHVVPSYDDW